MKNKKIMINGLLLAMSFTASAEFKWVEQPSVQKLTVSSEKFVVSNINKERVAFNQELLGQNHHTFQNEGYQAESRQFWLDFNAKQLTQGVNIPLSSNTAIIRINPLNSSAKSQVLTQQQVELSMAGQQVRATTFADAKQLKAAGMPVADSTVALKVETGSGQLNLKVNSLTAQNGQFVVHVFEPESEHILALKTNQQIYASGADITIQTKLHHADGVSPIEARGYVTSPNGEKVEDLNFKSSKEGDYQAVLKGLEGQSLIHGLWEVHTFTEANINGQKVLRDASTAFAVNLASAQFNGELDFTSEQLKFGIENALAARYEIRGTLMGHNEKGQKRPIALMMTAKWLEPGQTSLSFDWPTELVQSSGLTAPFEVTQLALKNQSSMVPVQRLATGVIMDELPETMTEMK